jgi:PhzF family phenazine biosynthesis protein
MYQTIHTVVFQAEKGGGNPCPVTLDADGLTADQMQEMTKQFGQESAYLMKPDMPGCDFRARYFVPLHEMEMCIHATIGSATVLVKKGLVTKSPLYYQTPLGRVRIDWERHGEDIDVAVEQFLPETAAKNPAPEQVCRALRIPESDLDLSRGPIQSVRTSRYKLIVPLRSRAVVDGLKPDFEALWNLCDEFDTTGFYVFALEKDPQGNPLFFARQFPKRAGYPEDPATGVAASALGAYVTLNHVLPVSEGWNSITIMQGFAMGRPSVIHSDTRVENGKIVQTRVRGRAFIV